MYEIVKNSDFIIQAMVFPEKKTNNNSSLIDCSISVKTKFPEYFFVQLELGLHLKAFDYSGWAVSLLIILFEG